MPKIWGVRPAHDTGICESVNIQFNKGAWDEVIPKYIYSEGSVPQVIWGTQCFGSDTQSAPDNSVFREVGTPGTAGAACFTAHSRVPH